MPGNTWILYWIDREERWHVGETTFETLSNEVVGEVLGVPAGEVLDGQFPVDSERAHRLEAATGYRASPTQYDYFLYALDNPYDPSTLGQVDAVDVIALDYSRAPKVRSVNEFIRSPAVIRERRLQAADAERIAALWRGLPPGEEARCHMPPFGLRFWSAGKSWSRRPCAGSATTLMGISTTGS
jgi:hypothetical protein